MIEYKLDDKGRIELPLSRRCLERIAISKHAETYCQLEQGHEGDHKLANHPMFRCQSTRDGKNCSQPAGHLGSHHVKDGAITDSWV